MNTPRRVKHTAVRAALRSRNFKQLRQTGESVNYGATTYTYDALNRLTGESGPAKAQPIITYDEDGNRKSDSAGSYV